MCVECSSDVRSALGRLCSFVNAEGERPCVHVYKHLNRLVKVDADIFSDLNQSLGVLFN